MELKDVVSCRFKLANNPRSIQTQLSSSTRVQNPVTEQYVEKGSKSKEVESEEEEQKDAAKPRNVCGWNEGDEQERYENEEFGWEENYCPRSVGATQDMHLVEGCCFVLRC